MAFTQSDLDAIDRAIASGTRRVQFENRLVEYGTLADLEKARNLITNELAVVSGRQQRRQIRVFTNKGFSS